MTATSTESKKTDRNNVKNRSETTLLETFCVKTKTLFTLLSETSRKSDRFPKNNVEAINNRAHTNIKQAFQSEFINDLLQ